MTHVEVGLPGGNSDFDTSARRLQQNSPTVVRKGEPEQIVPGHQGLGSAGLRPAARIGLRDLGRPVDRWSPT